MRVICYYPAPALTHSERIEKLAKKIDNILQIKLKGKIKEDIVDILQLLGFVVGDDTIVKAKVAHASHGFSETSLEIWLEPTPGEVDTPKLEERKQLGRVYISLNSDGSMNEILSIFSQRGQLLFDSDLLPAIAQRVINDSSKKFPTWGAVYSVIYSLIGQHKQECPDFRVYWADPAV